MRAVSGVLIDLGGVVYAGGAVIAGAAEAVAALRERGLPFRFLTNTTSQPTRAVVETLRGFGLAVEPSEILTPAIAAREHLTRHDLAPHYLVAQALLEDLPPAAGGQHGTRRKAVVIGDARDRFDFTHLNEAFRLMVEEDAALIALAGNRRFLDRDGRLSLDVGAFVAALEFAAERRAETLGKPAAGFFHAGAAALGLGPATVAMIGDDPEFDVAAAIQAGLQGVLVATGKWRPAAGATASPCDPPPSAVFDTLGAAVEAILEARAAPVDHAPSARPAAGKETE